MLQSCGPFPMKISRTIFVALNVLAYAGLLYSKATGFSPLTQVIRVGLYDRNHKIHTLEQISSLLISAKRDFAVCDTFDLKSDPCSMTQIKTNSVNYELCQISLSP